MAIRSRTAQLKEKYLQMAQQNNLLSFKRNAFQEGGALPDGRYLLRNHRFEKWDYDNPASGIHTCAMLFDAFPIAVDAKGNITVSGEMKKQGYSVGNLDKIEPSADGKGLVGLGTTTGLSKSSNFFTHIDNLYMAGFDESKYDNDITVFDEIAVDIHNIAQAKREGLPKSNLVQAGPPKEDRPRTIPVVKVIGKMPWDKKWNLTSAPVSPGSLATAAVATAAKTAAPEPADDGGGDGTDVNDPISLMNRFLPEILKNVTSQQHTVVRVSFFKAMGAAGITAEVKKAANTAFNDLSVVEAVLNSIGDGYTTDGTTLTSL
jgi:hypothetical protein